MTDKTTVPTVYWIVAGIALLWNLMGLFAFYTDMSTNAESFPLIVKAAYGIATIGGFLGSLGLILKKTWAPMILLISLLGVLVQSSYNAFMTDTLEGQGAGGIALFLAIIAIAIFLYLYAKKSASKGWLA